MAIPGTVPVTAPIAPTAAADNYGSHVDIYGKGGFRAVADNTERDAIPAGRRLEGMWVYVIATGLVWRLEPDLLSWTAVSIAGQRYRSSWIDAGAMNSTLTNGADTWTDETTTNDRTIDSWLFDQTTEESVQFKMAMPQEWDLGTLKVKFYWDAISGAGTVAWGIRAVAVGDGIAIDTPAWGTEIETVDTLIAVGDVQICTSASITVGNTPAADKLVFFQITRKTGTDNLNGDAKLMGIALQWHELAADSGSW